MSAPMPDQTLERLQGYEPLSCLTQEQVRELLKHSRFERLEAGATVFAAGDRDHQSVYLLSGTVDVIAANGSVLERLAAADEAARHPLSDDQPRRHSVRAASAIEIIRVDKILLDTLLTWTQISAPEEAVVMSEDGIITINKASWLNTMLKSPTFRSLPPANIEELLHQLEPVVVRAGDVIIRQGDQGDYFYMIDDGIGLVTRNPDNDEDSIEIAELNKGDTFGEAALISDNPRNATVSMMTDGLLLRLSKDSFIKLLTEPTLMWINYGQASRDAEAGAIWIDVRLPSEFSRAHLPGAINIPMSALHKQVRELDRSAHYICYCQTGRRSSAAAFTLRNYGMNASVLMNGLQNVPEDLMTAD